jgi:hypothetical protein
VKSFFAGFVYTDAKGASVSCTGPELARDVWKVTDEQLARARAGEVVALPGGATLRYYPWGTACHR